jgi:anti-anti-sigma factor
MTDVDALGSREPAVLVAYAEGVTVLDLVGEHDLATRPLFEAKIREQATLGRDVVVSLKDTDFVDSSIVAALFRAQRQITDAGRRFVLHTDCQSHILKTLGLTGVREKIPCADELTEAIALARRDR